MLTFLLLLTSCSNAGTENQRIDSDRSFSQYSTYVCETEDTVYFMTEDSIYYENLGNYPGSMLYYIDKITGISGPLCGKPECGHDSMNCNAYITNVIVLGLADYNGRLYWIANTGEKHYVYSAAYDGTDRQTVRELGDNDSEVRFEQPVIMTAFHRGYVYLTSNPSAIVDGEEQYRNYIYAYSLDSGGEDFVILDYESTDWIDARTQLYGNSMYIFLLDRSKEDGTSKLLKWDVETHELETLFDGKTPFAPTVDFWATEEGVFLIGTTFNDPVTDKEGNGVWERNVYFYDFSAGEFELLFPIIGAGGITFGFSDGLFTVKNDRELWRNPENAFDITVYDFNGQTVFADTFDTNILPFYVGMMHFAGADEKNLYFYTNFTGYLVCIPLDGGEPTVLHGNWTWD